MFPRLSLVYLYQDGIRWNLQCASEHTLFEGYVSLYSIQTYEVPNLKFHLQQKRIVQE
jgi:hypothetical protein